MTQIPPTSIDSEIARYLRTGDHDPLFSAWPGGVLERCGAGTDALREALLAELRRRVDGRQPSRLPDGYDVIRSTRAKIEPMVCGLFPKREQDAVLALLEKSVVFLTPDNVERVIAEQSFPRNAWDLANMYLLSVDAEPLSPDAPAIVGSSVDTTCYVSAEYFSEDDPFADFVVHEVAHIFHNCKRKTIGLAHTRNREWLLHIDFQKRETFAYCCEAYSRLVEGGDGLAQRRGRFERLKIGVAPQDRRVDADEYFSILAEAVKARNGWKRILVRCAPPASK